MTEKEEYGPKLTKFEAQEEFETKGRVGFGMLLLAGTIILMMHVENKMHAELKQRIEKLEQPQNEHTK